MGSHIVLMFSRTPMYVPFIFVIRQGMLLFSEYIKFITFGYGAFFNPNLNRWNSFTRAPLRHINEDRT